MVRNQRKYGTEYKVQAVQLPNAIGSSTLSHKTGVQLLGSSEGCTPIFNLYSHIDRMCFYDIV